MRARHSVGHVERNSVLVFMVSSFGFEKAFGRWEVTSEHLAIAGSFILAIVIVVYLSGWRSKK